MAHMGPSSSEPEPLRPPASVIRTSHRSDRVQSTDFSSSQPSAARGGNRAPTITRHSSRMIALPTPDLVGSIASGAHYAGGLSPPPHLEHFPHDDLTKHRRTLSMSADDPAVHQAYQEVMADLEELYCGRPTIEIFERRFRRDAEYEDPLCKCVGFNEYVAQFYALPKVFSECKRLHSRILSAAFNPNKLVFSQTQEYTFRLIGIKRTITSFVLVDLDDEFKIVHMVEQWNGAEPPTRWGSLWLRKLSAKVIPWFVRVPRSRTL